MPTSPWLIQYPSPAPGQIRRSTLNSRRSSVRESLQQHDSSMHFCWRITRRRSPSDIGGVIFNEAQWVSHRLPSLTLSHSQRYSAVYAVPSQPWKRLTQQCPDAQSNGRSRAQFSYNGSRWQRADCALKRAWKGRQHARTLNPGATSNVSDEYDWGGTRLAGGDECYLSVYK